MSAITMQLESMVARDLSSNRNSTRRQLVARKRTIAVLEQSVRDVTEQVGPRGVHPGLYVEFSSKQS